MKYPRITANLALLKQNAATILEACKQRGVQLAAVTKVTCANSAVAQALAETGVSMLADSRLINLSRLPRSLPRLCLRVSAPEEAEEVVLRSEYSLQSGIPAIRALGKAARKLGKRHGIVLMIDLGDLREGIYFRETALIHENVEAILKEEGLELAGIGCNLTCFGGILPDETNMAALLGIAQTIRAQYQVPLPLISGGNSSSLRLLFDGSLPKGITQLRVGEGLMLGMDTYDSTPFPQLSQQAFTLYAQLVEVYEKPSKPEGKTGPNAFGEQVFFEDHGPMRRGILALGRQDTDQDGLTPLDSRVGILGGSSDHLLVDLTRAPELQVGDVLGFTPAYGALLKVYTSEYVWKSHIDEEGNEVHE